MKKVLLPFEGERYPRELLNFTEVLNPMAPMLLTAAFVPESDYVSMVASSGLAESVGSAEYEQNTKVVNYHSRLLTRFCDERGIRLKVHMDPKDFAVPCLKEESRYSDLLLLSGAHFFEEEASEQPNAWMREILRHAECPVLLLPDKTELPGELLLAYDGSADAMYAIRQFAYLFPEFMSVQATLVYVNEDPGAKIPHEAAVRELCSLHYRKFRVLQLKMKTPEFYHTWIGMKTNPWLVAGSYGRSAFSEALAKSFSSEMIREHQIPVFVAHK